MRALAATVGSSATIHPRTGISRDRHASVSVLAACAMPVCLGVMGLGIDVSQWAMVRQQLQGIADLAALAGAGHYAFSLNSAQALSAATGVAEVNGLPVGAASAPTNGYSATIAFGSNPPQVSVTIQRQVSLSFARLLTNATAQTVSATAVAQVFKRTSGSQACVLGLQGFTNQQTSGTDLTLNGNPETSMTGCDLRSDAGISFKGSFSVDVPQIVASGTITTSGGTLTCSSGDGCDAQLTGMPQIPDPFAGNYGGLLDSIPSGSSSLKSNGGTASYSPGSYQSISFKGNGSVNLAPGVYYVSGDVSVGAGTTITGSGVTLIAGGNVTINGGATVNLTAPDSGATAGLAIAATGSSVTLGGGDNFTLVGAIYAPDGDVTMNGNSSTNPGTCLVIVASTVTMSGDSSFTNSGCGTLGVPATYDLPGEARLVQ